MVQECFTIHLIHAEAELSQLLLAFVFSHISNFFSQNYFDKVIGKNPILITYGLEKDF